MAVILLDIRSSENAGSICRTAEGAGVSEMYCVGTSPIHLDRFGRPNKKFLKASLGAEKNIEVAYFEDITSLLSKLKKEKFQIVALEQTKNSIDYKKFKPQSRLALILGNEVTGIPKKVLKKADKVIEIPMLGKKESLNVSVAFGIVVFAVGH